MSERPDSQAGNCWLPCFQACSASSGPGDQSPSPLNPPASQPPSGLLWSQPHCCLGNKPKPPNVEFSILHPMQPSSSPFSLMHIHETLSMGRRIRGVQLGKLQSRQTAQVQWQKGTSFGGSVGEEVSQCSLSKNLQKLPAKGNI